MSKLECVKMGCAVPACYLGSLAELIAWAQAHSEYARHQVLDLTGVIADSKGLKKRERAAMLAQMEQALADSPSSQPGQG